MGLQHAQPPKLRGNGLFIVITVWHAIYNRASLVLISTLAVVVLATTPADGAAPTVYELPNATHASSLAVAPDGTVWFVPTRGTKWSGESKSILGSVSPEGVVTEHEVTGFGAITSLAVSPAGEIWIAGGRGRDRARWRLEIGRVSSSGSLQAVYPVGGGGEIASLHAADGAVWFIRVHWGRSAPTTIQSISAMGAVRHISLHHGCTPWTVTVGPDGMPWFTGVCATARRGGRDPRRAFIAKIEANGTIMRRKLAEEEWPTSITVTSDGTAWFSLSQRHIYAGVVYDYSKIGLITAVGDLAKYRLGGGSSSWLAAGSEDRVWFPSAIGRGYARAINSIGVDGQIGKPICAYPTCALAPSDLTAAPDGSIWYSLRRPNLNDGGGGSGFHEEEEIGNEAGFIAHFVP